MNKKLLGGGVVTALLVSLFAVYSSGAVDNSADEAIKKVRSATDSIVRRLGGVSAFNEIALNPSDDQPQPLVTGIAPYVMGAVTGQLGSTSGTTTAAWQNLTGKTVFVELQYALVPTNGSGIASSTFFLEAATSTTRDVPISTFFAYAGLLNRVLVGTGTAPYFASSLSQAIGPVASTSLANTQAGQLGASFGFATTSAEQALYGQRFGMLEGVRSRAMVMVKPLEYVQIHMMDFCVAQTQQSGGDRVCSATEQRGGISGFIIAEKATSTNLGLAADWKLIYYSTTTLPQ